MTFVCRGTDRDLLELFIFVYLILTRKFAERPCPNKTTSGPPVVWDQFPG